MSSLMVAARINMTDIRQLVSTVEYPEKLPHWEKLTHLFVTALKIDNEFNISIEYNSFKPVFDTIRKKYPYLRIVWCFTSCPKTLFNSSVKLCDKFFWNQLESFQLFNMEPLDSICLDFQYTPEFPDKLIDILISYSCRGKLVIEMPQREPQVTPNYDKVMKVVGYTLHKWGVYDDQPWLTNLSSWQRSRMIIEIETCGYLKDKKFNRSEVYRRVYVQQSYGSYNFDDERDITYKCFMIKCAGNQGVLVNSFIGDRQPYDDTSVIFICDMVLGDAPGYKL